MQRTDDSAGEPMARRVEALAAGGAVHVVDDDEAVRTAFRMLLRAAGLKVVPHESAEAFMDHLARGAGRIACVLTDLRMPGLDGLELLRQLRAAGFARPIILVTARGDVPIAVRAMKEGAADFIEKPCTERQLFDAIAMALERSAMPALSPADETLREEARARIALLTPRERQVLDLLATGRANKEVARALALSPRTVEIHRARMMARLGARSFAEAVRLAVRAEAPPSEPALDALVSAAESLPAAM